MFLLSLLLYTQFKKFQAYLSTPDAHSDHTRAWLWCERLCTLVELGQGVLIWLQASMQDQDTVPYCF